MKTFVKEDSIKMVKIFIIVVIIGVLLQLLVRVCKSSKLARSDSVSKLK